MRTEKFSLIESWFDEQTQKNAAGRSVPTAFDKIKNFQFLIKRRLEVKAKTGTDRHVIVEIATKKVVCAIRED